MRKLKKIAACVLAFALMLQTLNMTAMADDDKTACIVGFEDFDVTAHYLAVDRDNRASLEALTAAMPKELSVYVAGADEPVAASVSWSCIDGDYENMDDNYTQFSPVFENMTVSDSIDIYREAPYIGVFLLSAEDMAVQTAVVASEEMNGDDPLNQVAGVRSYSHTPSPYEIQIYEYLTNDMGYNSAVASGIMANIFRESSFFPNNLEDSKENEALDLTDVKYTAAVDNGSYSREKFVHDGYGYGLIQWTYWSRKQGLYDYAKAEGKSIGDCLMQLNYMKKEVSGYKSLIKIMEEAPNSEQGAVDVAYHWCNIFEKPGDLEKELIKRTELAKNDFWPIYASGIKYERLSGASRYATAMATADKLLELRGQETFDAIVVAGGRNYPDALGGVPLAYELQAPILLIGPTGEENNSKKTIEYIKTHLAPKGKVILLGGTNVVSELTETTLKDLQFDVTRLGGDTRYITNIKVAEAMAPETGSPVFIVSGRNFPDALSVSGMAAIQGAPIILTSTTLKEDALAYIAALEPSTIYLIGGPDAVSENVRVQLSSYDNVIRISDKNRYATSAKIAKTFENDTMDAIVAATGQDYPDGLVAGLLSAELRVPLFLVNETHTALAKDFMTAHDMMTFYVVGGPSVVSQNTVLPLAK